MHYPHFPIPLHTTTGREGESNKMSLADSSSSSGVGSGDALTAPETVITTKRRDPNGSSHEEISSCTTPNSFAASFSSQGRKRIKKMVTLCTSSGLLGSYTTLVIVSLAFPFDPQSHLCPVRLQLLWDRHQQTKSEECTGRYSPGKRDEQLYVH